MPHVAPHGLDSDLQPACSALDMAVAHGGVSSADFRHALAKLVTPVSIIATDGPAGPAGLTCSAVCAVSDQPPMLLVCVHGKSAANAVIKSNGVLCVNCLQVGQKDLSQAFAGIGSVPMRERFAMSDWGVLATGAPHCKGALVALDCKVADMRDMGTHTIFIAQVMATAESSEAAGPLIYQQRAYGTVRSL
jgi:flavin reductase (DIM6/NTAB) family NADH-FMN oxidoreductase RutF